LKKFKLDERLSNIKIWVYISVMENSFNSLLIYLNFWFKASLSQRNPYGSFSRQRRMISDIKRGEKRG